jgi:hypothetical protein
LPHIFAAIWTFRRPLRPFLPAMSAPAPARLKLYRRLNGFLFPPGGVRL